MVHGGGVVKWGLGVAARGMLGPVRITASKQVGKEGVNPLAVRVDKCPYLNGLRVIFSGGAGV